MGSRVASTEKSYFIACLSRLLNGMKTRPGQLDTFMFSNQALLRKSTMKNHVLSYLLIRLVPLLCLCFTPASPPDVTGSWRMTAHRLVPAQDGISDIYSHFKELYGGCQEDMGLTLNADGSLKLSPVRGCQNPLGNLIMKAATKFMPAGKATWESKADKIVLQDAKGQRKEYELHLNGTTMEWVFDEMQKQTTVRHTIEFKRE